MIAIGNQLGYRIPIRILVSSIIRVFPPPTPRRVASRYLFRGAEVLSSLAVIISLTMPSILTPAYGSSNASGAIIPVSSIDWRSHWTFSAKSIPNSPRSLSSAWKVLPKNGCISHPSLQVSRRRQMSSALGSECRAYLLLTTYVRIIKLFFFTASQIIVNTLRHLSELNPLNILLEKNMVIVNTVRPLSE